MKITLVGLRREWVPIESINRIFSKAENQVVVNGGSVWQFKTREKRVYVFLDSGGDRLHWWL